MGTVPLADVRQAGAGGPLMFFQLYVFKDRDFVKRLVQRELPPLCRHAPALFKDWRADTVLHAAIVKFVCS